MTFKAHALSDDTDWRLSYLSDDDVYYIVFTESDSDNEWSFADFIYIHADSEEPCRPVSVTWSTWNNVW